MPDNLNTRGGQDPALISLSQEHELRYWTGALGIPEDELRRLVAEVGNNAETVRAALAEKNPPSILIER